MTIIELFIAVLVLINITCLVAWGWMGLVVANSILAGTCVSLIVIARVVNIRRNRKCHNS